MKKNNKNSDARIRANNNFIKKNYSKITVTLKNELAEQVQTYCNNHNKSKNGFITEIIIEKLNEENKK